MSSERFRPHPPEAELPPLSPEERRDINEYIDLLRKSKDSLLGPLETKQMLKLLEKLGAERVATYTTAFERGFRGPPVPEGYERKVA